MGVAITGLGIVSAIGLSVEENLHALRERRSGIAPMQILNHRPDILTGEVKLSNEELVARLGIANKLISRTSMLALHAAREAFGSTKHTPGIRTGLISSTSVGGMDGTERFYKDFLASGTGDFQVLKCHDSGSTSERIAAEMGISGYVNTLSTACSSGVNAIMLGARLILQGRLDRVLVGGTDALTSFTMNGFRSLMIYDQEWCRPFDDTRNGLNLGEGAGFLLLENEKSLAASANEVMGYVRGWANAADAYHQTASSPDGKGATLAISQAIRTSGLKASDIDYVNAHGTGTKNNDLSETVALKNVFGDDVPAFSSTKAFTGHTLAAAGAIESVFSVLAITHGVQFPNLNFSNVMAEDGLTPVTEVVTGPVNTVLSNSFGFGGNNSSVVFSRFQS